ncbi:hypothetical protein PIB30_103312, partial [Stylosanthes scabra]|nr:hypothetical protein [Stylosanthes scabra]
AASHSHFTPNPNTLTHTHEQERKRGEGMVTASAKGNVVTAIADDIRGRGSELREKHELMERIMVVMDAVIAGNSVSVTRVAKESERSR